MHILADIILDVNNAFQNKSFPIHEIFYVSPTPYHLDWFERYYPNFTLNQYDVSFVFYVLLEFKEKNHTYDNGI